MSDPFSLERKLRWQWAICWAVGWMRTRTRIVAAIAGFAAGSLPAVAIADSNEPDLAKFYHHPAAADPGAVQPQVPPSSVLVENGVAGCQARMRNPGKTALWKIPFTANIGDVTYSTVVPYLGAGQAVMIFVDCRYLQTPLEGLHPIQGQALTQWSLDAWLQAGCDGVDGRGQRIRCEIVAFDYLRAAAPRARERPE